nr:AT hook motif-containing protein, putative [Tanacetum cinerariifolium]
MGLATSSMAKKGQPISKEKQLLIRLMWHLPKQVAEQRELGAASIAKKIIVDLKGKAIADTNNVATTKKGRTTTWVQVSYHSLGAPSYQCPNCDATMWYEERNNKANKDQNPTFSLCFQQGKVLLPQFKDTPEPLNRLFDYNQPVRSTFRDLIRVYNGMFCFTSFKARIDHSINKGRGLYTLPINRQNYHRIGSLLPTEGTQPSEEGVDGAIVGSLIRMVDANSANSKAFRMARDWCLADTTANVELRMLSERTKSKQYSSSTVSEVASLITNDFGDEEPIRDIVVCKKDSPSKRISELHPSYMALQYPLLFPYGEDGYHEKIIKDQRTTLHRGGRGTGKTFLYKTIISRLRSELKIVLVVASSGIASLLLPDGKTAHIRFVIPLELLENITCGIKQNTHLAKHMQQVELIIWDEAPMTQKYAFEALDKTLKDILGYPNLDKRNKIFGGMMVLLGGVFRKFLPVIPKGKRAGNVQACINRSKLWKHCKVSTLKRMPARTKDGGDEPTWIEIPETFLIPSSESPIQQIVKETYPNFIQRKKDDTYLRERAILTPRNGNVDAINAYMFDKLAGRAITYHSANEICKGSTDTLDQHNLYPTEFLNTLNFHEMSPHALTLKKEHSPSCY